MKSPRGFKTHMPFQHKFGGDLENSPAKYIYTYRNPKDTAVSYYHFAKAYGPPTEWDTFIEDFMQGAVMYGKVLDHLMGWWEQQGKKCKCDVNSGLWFYYEVLLANAKIVMVMLEPVRISLFTIVHPR